MNTTPPLVAFVGRAHMLHEALADALDEIAEVRFLPAGRPDPVGLLTWLRPDAIVVDDVEERDRLEPFARATDTPLLVIGGGSGGVVLFEHGEWTALAGVTARAESLRNIVVPRLFKRRDDPGGTVATERVVGGVPGRDA